MVVTLTPDEFRERVRVRAEERYPDWKFSPVEDSHGLGLRADLGNDAGTIMYMHNTYQLHLTGVDAERAVAELIKGLDNIANAASLERYLGDFAVAREHLMVQLSIQYDDDDQEPKNRRIFLPWQGGLVLYPVIDLSETLLPITAYQAEKWQVDVAELVALGIVRTRDRLAATTGAGAAITPLPGIALTVWSNDLPGYSATRAVWPDLALPALPTGDGYGIVCAPDRDFCVSLLVDDIASTEAMLGSSFLASIVKTRVGQPRPLMAPGLAFCRPDGSYEYQAILLPGDGEPD